MVSNSAGYRVLPWIAQLDFHSIFMIWQWFLCASAMSDDVKLDGRAVKAGITADGAAQG
jgi:hypothetical protein